MVTVRQRRGHEYLFLTFIFRWGIV